ncbi:hypothetical protein [Pseudomonas sp. 1152_12]|uniref:hypothetical protein n=1 Tax=Pseudomonas sp. 1152_12 TaxID=2604455 RepID=UPI0040628BF6
MLSISASIASFYSHYEASKINTEKPTPNPPQHGDGNDVLRAGSQSGNDVLMARKATDLQSLHPQQERLHKLFETAQIDNGDPVVNPIDQTAGDDAEVFDPATQYWQATQAAGNGQYTALGDPYREAIDFEIKADGMGGWQQA